MQSQFWFSKIFKTTLWKVDSFEWKSKTLTSRHNLVVINRIPVKINMWKKRNFNRQPTSEIRRRWSLFHNENNSFFASTFTNSDQKDNMLMKVSNPFTLSKKTFERKKLEIRQNHSLKMTFSALLTFCKNKFRQWKINRFLGLWSQSRAFRSFWKREQDSTSSL